MTGQDTAKGSSGIRGGGERGDIIDRGRGSEVAGSGIDGTGRQVIPGGPADVRCALDGETPGTGGAGRGGTRVCHRPPRATGEPELPPRCGTRLQPTGHRLDEAAAGDRCSPPGRQQDRDTGEGTLEVSLVNDLREVDGVTARIGEFCVARDLAPEISVALNLAIDELLTGSIIDGYDDDEPHRTEIVVCLEGDWLVVAMADEGRAIDALPAREPEGGALLEAMSAGTGRLFFARRVVEGVRYRRTDGCNVVTLTKRARH